MALFSKIDTCILCGEGKKVKMHLKEGPLCKECYKMHVPSFNELKNFESLLGKSLYDFTRSDMLELKKIREKELEEKEEELFKLKELREKEKQEKELKDKENHEKFNKFTATDSVLSYLEVDRVKKQWLIPEYSFLSKKPTKVYSFSDIVSYQLIIDDNMEIIGKAKGNVEVKKKIKKMYIKVVLNDIDNPVVFINISVGETTEGSFAYKSDCKTAQKILDLLNTINKSNLRDKMDNKIEKVEQAQRINDTTKSLEQIKTLKELLDMGAITEDEFNTKKKELLGINI